MKHSELIRVFRAFTDSTRLEILEILRNGEQCARVLLEDLDISQPTLSHHMKILCRSGIVKCRKAGRWSYYEIDAEGCGYAKKLLDGVADKTGGMLMPFIRLARYRLDRLPLRPAIADGRDCPRARIAENVS